MPDRTSASANVATELHAELTARWPSRYSHLERSALVLDTVPSSEDRQRKLIQLTIESADKLAILTSFNINPTKDHEAGHVSGTTFAMMESLARRQHDEDFTFVMLYNSNKLQTNAVVAAIVGQNITANISLKNQSHVPGTVTWPAVVEAYNRQQVDEQLRIRSVRCRLYFVAAKARGAAGSHHNKFGINDRGVAATLGASIANKTKDGWIDGGCIALGTSLAASQRDYFLDELVGKHKVACARLLLQDGHPSMEPVAQPASVLASLREVDMQSPFDGASGNSLRPPLVQALARTGIPASGHRQPVLWIQNPSDGYRNVISTGSRIEGKPIGFSLRRVFATAGPGDTLDIATKTMGTESFQMLAQALARGCDVNVLVTQASRSSLESAARRLYRHSPTPPPGTLSIKHYAPGEALSHSIGVNLGSEHVMHAKNYLLTRKDGSCTVMTGSYNLDGQSHYRSNENLMVFESADLGLRRALFAELYEGSECPASRYVARS